MLQSDIRSHERYAAISGRPTPKAEFPDWCRRPELPPEFRSKAALDYHLARIEARALGRDHPVGDHTHTLPERMTTLDTDAVRRSQPWIDPEMTELMRRG